MRATAAGAERYDASTAELADGRRLERVADLVSPSPCPHQPGVAQHLQVLADGRLADPEGVGEVASAGARLLCEPQRDAEPHGMSERLEAAGCPLVHLTHYIAFF